ncbi:flagellar hook-length control protein FliK [Paracoccus tibetensis]|uniref:Hook-length control protein FliK n=1 Tax=Paracoccus tibetensis TaxID=336292 RepID=A0A1G5ESP3_9RHOB|nr:flagellar hook-length control protein FliK [Paracoccus tibetensis]SCY29458.1 hook-length control protein FliK [Paracoccus tibetensis]
MSEISQILSVLPATVAPAEPGEAERAESTGFTLDPLADGAAPAPAAAVEDALEDWLAARSGVTAQLAEPEVASDDSQGEAALAQEAGSTRAPVETAEVEGLGAAASSPARTAEAAPQVSVEAAPAEAAYASDGGTVAPEPEPQNDPAREVVKELAVEEGAHLAEDASIPQMPAEQRQAHPVVAQAAPSLPAQPPLEAAAAPQPDAPSAAMANQPLQAAPAAVPQSLQDAVRKAPSSSSGSTTDIVATAGETPAGDERRILKAARALAEAPAAVVPRGAAALPAGFEAAASNAPPAPADALAVLPALPAFDREIRLPTPLGAQHGPGAHAAPPPGRQIAEAVLVSRGEATEILLAPEELGRLRMVVTGSDRSQLVIWAERPETLELLRRNADLLSADLAEAGLASASMEFRQGGEWQAPVRFEAAATGDTDFAVVPPLAAARRYIDPQRRIDIRV